eukprot:138711-Alexandrium_andersonii.AAC.1
MPSASQECGTQCSMPDPAASADGEKRVTRGCGRGAAPYDTISCAAPLGRGERLSLIHISQPTRLALI